VLGAQFKYLRFVLAEPSELSGLVAQFFVIHLNVWLNYLANPEFFWV